MDGGPNQKADTFDLSGRVALVTGGGRGIGRAVSITVAERGAHVMVADIDGASARRVAAEIGAAGGAATEVEVDVRAPHRVEAMIDHCVAVAGRLDILVNNAGGFVDSGGVGADEGAVHEWRSALELNLTGAFLCSMSAARQMTRQQYGKIVNIASVYGFLAQDFSLVADGSGVGAPEALGYAAAKGGIVALTRNLATYLSPHNVNVNAIAPGMVQTEQVSARRSREYLEALAARVPLSRLARPADLGGSVVFLASAASDYVTGHVLVVDGGWSIW